MLLTFRKSCPCSRPRDFRPKPQLHITAPTPSHPEASLNISLVCPSCGAPWQIGLDAAIVDVIRSAPPEALKLDSGVPSDLRLVSDPSLGASSQK